MLDYFKVFKERKSNSKFLFVTGEKSQTIYQIADQKNIDRKDIIITSCLHKDVPLNISIFDLSIFFIRPTYSKKASSPTKQGEIMAMGIPLVCNSGVGDTDWVVKKYKAGSVIESFSNDNYLKVIEFPDEIDQDLMMQGAKEFYSLDSGVEKYFSVYEKIYKYEK